MATVHHPDADYSGTATIGRRRLEFTDGQAVLHGPAASWRRAGYRVTGEERPALLEDMTVAELRERAEASGVEVPGKARKADIIAALTGEGDEQDS